MASRHRAREYALQMLYQAEAAGMPMPEVLTHFWQDAAIPLEVRAFSERLALGTEQARPEIDALLSSCLDNWRMERLALVDRNVLRLAVYEFLREPETPRVVIIDEAIEVAKRFGGEDSGQFVNGILDALRRRLEGTEAAGPGAGTSQDPGATPSDAA
jgi:N utilization substance protein B